jgi:hypothetical protein
MKKNNLTNPKNGDLKVSLNLKNQKKELEYSIYSVQEGFIIIDALYFFMNDNNLSYEFGLMVYDNKFGWCNWYSDLGGVIDNYIKEENGLELLNKHLN